MANKCYHGLKLQLKSYLLSIKTKIKLYKTLIRPVLLYGAESWALSKATENKLQIFERKVLRKIYGPTQEADIWRVKYNSELYDLYNEPDIIKVVKAERMRWLGHLRRMEEGNICKRVTFHNMIGTRKRGRPSLRWIDSVHKDLQRTGVKNWRMEAMDRSMWKGVVKTVLA